MSMTHPKQKIQILNKKYRDLSWWFSGCETKRGRYGGLKKDQKTKICYVEPLQFDWQLHQSGDPKNMQGLSPVNLDGGTARWGAIDFDQNIDPKQFCRRIFSLVSPELVVFRTISGRFRIVKFYGDDIAVEDVEKELELIEKQINALGYKTDSGARCPRGYNVKDDAEGRWIFLPYHNPDVTYAYSPSGTKLTQSQIEFRLHYRNNPLVVASVGLGEGNRHKSLWCAEVYNKCWPDNKINLEDLNKNFENEKGIDDFDSYCKHISKSALSTKVDGNDKWDKDSYLKGLNTWIKDFVGASPQFDSSMVQEVVDGITDKYIYLRINADFFEIESKDFVDKEQMNDWWADKVQGQKIVPTLLRNPNMIKVHSYFTHPGVDPGVAQIDYNQIPGIKPGVYYNMYLSGPYESKPGNYKPFIDYYTWLFGDDAIHMFNMLALLLQRPGFKSHWGILQITPQGAGKDFWAEIFQIILGEKNCHINISFEALTRDHSTLLDGCQLMVINELILTGNRVEGKILSNKLKPYITNPIITLNPKFKQEIQIPNFCNFFLFSNDEKPIKLEKDDRRFCVMRTRHIKTEIHKKIKNYIPIFESYKKDPGALIDYFKNIHKLPQEDYFRGDAPHTKAKAELINIGKVDFDSLLDSAKDERTFPFADYTWDDAKGDTGSRSGWQYCGIVNIDNLYQAIKYHPKFRGVYFDKAMLQEWINCNYIPWPNGEKDKRAFSGSGRCRVVLLEDLIIKPTAWKTTEQWPTKKVSEFTEKELGSLYSNKCFSLRSATEIPVEPNQEIIKEVY